MKLQKGCSGIYTRHFITIPKAIVKALEWETGDNLEVRIDFSTKGLKIIRKTTKEKG